MEIIEILKWPIVVIILFLVFYKPIKTLIDRVTNIDKHGIKAESKALASQESPLSLEKDTDFEVVNEKDAKSKIEKGLSIFSEETIQRTENVIKDETKIDEVKKYEDKYKLLLDYTKNIYIILHFERVYCLIYGSQIRLLQHLNANFNETKETLKFYYDNAAKIYPEAYAKYEYESFLNFLITQELIVHQGENIVITWLGRDFLKFIVERGLSDSRLY